MTDLFARLTSTVASRNGTCIDIAINYVTILDDF